MLTSLFSDFTSFILSVLYILPISLISLTFHECAHGFVAYKLGDPTAKEQGRLTLNPLAHLDPLGFIFMLFFRVGYAKPVPINPMYFKNPKKGILLTAAAGPASNLILAVVSSFFTVLFNYALYFNFSNKLFDILYTVFLYMTLINIGLAIFNLIPIHPFDGSRILGYFMPNSYHSFIYKYGNYIYIAFFVLLLATDFVSTAISSVQTSVAHLLFRMWATPAYLLYSIF